MPPVYQPPVTIKLSSLETTLWALRSFVWVVFLVFLAFCVKMFFRDLGASQNILQQNTSAAVNLFIVVCGYAAARGVDSILRVR